MAEGSAEKRCKRRSGIHSIEDRLTSGTFAPWPPQPELPIDRHTIGGFKGRPAMAITGVLRPGHVAIRVREMEPAVRHYTEVLGLIETARDGQGRVFLKAWDEHDHHSVVLRKAAEAGMDYMGWRVDSSASLDRLPARGGRTGRGAGRKLS